MKDTLRIIREIIREEIGRNIQSLPAVDTMYDWRHVDGIDADVSPHPSQGGWYVRISTASESLPARFFTDETSAKFWAREQVMRIQRKMMARQK
jgi:hypothetical protein